MYIIQMKKQELIQLHQLMAVLEQEITNQFGIPAAENEQKEQYLSLNVKPTSIHKSKTDHKEGVKTLCGSIAENLQGRQQKDTNTPKIEV